MMMSIALSFHPKYYPIPTVKEMSSTPSEQQPSLFMTCVISFGALSGGFATGVWYQFRSV
jgi:hypothetical protein